MRNILFMGLKLFLAIAGGSSSGIDKSDSSPMQVLYVHTHSRALVSGSRIRHRGSTLLVYGGGGIGRNKFVVL